MNCPFCHCANAATARACRVCGGPLRATAPKLAPISVVAPKSIPLELARQTCDENGGALASASFFGSETPQVCLVRADSVVQIWDIESDENSSLSLARLFRRTSPMGCALATANFIAVGQQDGQVRWHRPDARELKSPASHVGRVLSLAANATHFYSGGNDGVIWATALENNRKVVSCALIEGLGALTTFAVSPDATLVAVGCDDGAVQLWRVNAEQTAAKLDWTRRNSNAPIRSLMFSSNGQMIVSRDRESVLGLWAAQTSYQLPLAAGARSSHVAPAFLGDSCLLAIANADNGVDIFDVATEKSLHKLPPLNEKTRALAFATNAPWLLVAGEREIAVWKL